MAARKDKQGRRMVSGHYVKDAFFFMQDLQEALLMLKTLLRLMLVMLNDL